MAGSVNKVILVGNVGKDPEVKSFNNGGKIVEFSIATSERWTDKGSGEKREKTEWHRVSVRNEALARVAENYVRKGSKIYVEGQLQTREWTDQQGQKRYTTEVVLAPFRGELTLLDGREGGAGASGGRDMAESYGGGSGGGDRYPGNGGSGNMGGGRPQQDRQSFAADLNDDVPF
jgi:single-strand DNA-binding protein